MWESIQRLVTLWAYSYLQGNKSRAFDIDDLKQAVFLAMLDALKNYDPEKSGFITYLRYHVRRQFSIVAGIRTSRRDAADYAASLETTHYEDSSMTLKDLITDPSADFVTDIIEAEAARQDVAALMVEIDRLPDEQRRALLLTSWHGLRTKDAAAVMSTTPEFVRKCLTKAIHTLRKTRTGRILGISRYPRYYVPSFPLGEYRR